MALGIGSGVGFICRYLCAGYLQERKQKVDRESRFRSLKEELEQNLRIAQSPFRAGGLAMLKFQSSGWENARGDLESDTYPPNVRPKLRNVYADMHEFNGLVATFESTRDGRLQNVAEQTATRVRQRIEEIEALLTSQGHASR